MNQGLIEQAPLAVKIHMATVIGLYVGALLIAGAFTFVPGRLMYGLFFG